MAICDSGCAVALPCPYGNACGVEPKPGGINRIGFIACDYEFTDITDQAEWDAAILAGDAVFSGLLMGAKPKGTFTKKKVNSCSPERVVGGEKSITFQDYNSDAAGGTLEYTFWNTILANPAAYRLVYITCDGYLYGPIDDFTIEVDEVIDDDNKGNRYMDGTILWNSISIPIPEEVDLEFDQDSSATPC
jgi:hypothetical protein